MCSINIDEYAIHMSIVARLSHLCVLHSWNLKRLLDYLDNWRMMHDF
jgi:hypothetical protein